MNKLSALESVYHPRFVEPEVYASWEQSGAFRSQPADPPVPHERTFTIVMPPPNVTGALHLGHALNSTLQDILVRYHRMRGFNTLWQPGTDHAGIATQAVVERIIREQEGKSRHDLGREELVRRIWEWKDKFEKRILEQLKLLGCSADWERNRFTLDDGLARAVRQMFFDLFKDGHIFRGKRLVNWDTDLQTAVADDEIYYETIQGQFWHFKYPVIDPQPGEPEYVIIATTRPETMLGDTAVAVNPDPAGALDRAEEKLKALWDRLQAMPVSSRSGKEAAEIEKKLEVIRERRETHVPVLLKLAAMARAGRKIKLPLVCREIPLLADEWADPSLGSGCVKITPAHDPNDYEVGLRHKLPMINVLSPDGKVARIVEQDGTVNPHSARYEGLAFTTDARQRVVADLVERGLLDQVEDRDREVGHSDRSKTAIEPYLSDQWFVRTGDGIATKGEPLCGTTSCGTDLQSVKEHRLETGATPSHRLETGATQGLAASAMQVVEQGRIRIFPERYTKSYLDWLGEKRDWCISRQLWWGHRIPIWHKKVTLTERNWSDHILGAGLDTLVPGKWNGANDEAHVVFCRADTGRPVDPCEALNPVVKETEGDYDIYIGSIDEAGGTYYERDGYVRDPDVLDTWFSSALWPFSTLGWPTETPHLKQFYPGRVLVTSRDIITNWVARMVMFGLYAMGKVPFDHVYIHPKILDGRGETMSKSKGNGVDPVDIIHTHGADALRYTMADMCTETQDIRMPVDYVCPYCGKLTDQAGALKAEEQNRKSRGQKLERKLQPSDCRRVKCNHKECGKEFATQWADAAAKDELTVARETSEKFEIGRNFCNKLWNAARYAFMNLGTCGTDLQSVKNHRLKTGATEDHRLETGATLLMPEDRWILAKLSQAIREYHQAIKTYQFSAAIKVLREFFWDSLCDWYLELTKPRLASCTDLQSVQDHRLETGATESHRLKTSATPEAGSGATARQVLAFCLDQSLRLLHPTVPFITERLWSHLNGVAPQRGLPGLADAPPSDQLVRAKFPPLEGYPALDNAEMLVTFSELQDATRGVRDLRMRCNVPPKQKVNVTVVVPAHHVEPFRAQAHIVKHMANVETLTVAADAQRPPNAGSIASHGLRIYVHDISDDDAERDRATKALAAVEKQITAREGKLNNPGFVAKADPELIGAERQRLTDQITERDNLRHQLAELG